MHIQKLNWQRKKKMLNFNDLYKCCVLFFFYISLRRITWFDNSSLFFFLLFLVGRILTWTLRQFCSVFWMCMLFAVIIAHVIVNVLAITIQANTTQKSANNTNDGASVKSSKESRYTQTGHTNSPATREDRTEQKKNLYYLCFI